MQKTTIEHLAQLVLAEDQSGNTYIPLTGRNLDTYASAAPAATALEGLKGQPINHDILYTHGELTDLVIDALLDRPGPISWVDVVNARTATDPRHQRIRTTLASRPIGFGPIHATFLRLPVGYMYLREMRDFVIRLWSVDELDGRRADFEEIVLGPEGVRPFIPGKSIGPTESRHLVVRGEGPRRTRINLGAKALRATFETDQAAMDLIALNGGSAAKCFVTGAMIEPLSGYVAPSGFLVGAAFPGERVIDTNSACLVAPSHANAQYLLGSQRIVGRLAPNADRIDAVLSDVYEIERWLCWSVAVGNPWTF